MVLKKPRVVLAKLTRGGDELLNLVFGVCKDGRWDEGDGVSFECEFSNDSEIQSAAFGGPEETWVGNVGGCYLGAVAEDDRVGDQVVNGVAVFVVHAVEASNEGSACYADGV